MPSNDDELSAALAALAETSGGTISFTPVTTREVGNALGVEIGRSPNPVYRFTYLEGGVEHTLFAFTLALDGGGRAATRAEALGRAIAVSDGRLFELNPFLLIFDYVGRRFMAVSAAKLFGAFASEVRKRSLGHTETASFSLTPSFSKQTVSMYATVSGGDIWNADVAKIDAKSLIAGLAKIQRETSEIANTRAEIVAAVQARLSPVSNDAKSLAAPRSRLLSLDEALLERLKQTFLSHCTDFSDFSQRDGVYWREEREYKDRLIAAAQTAISDGSLTDEALGLRMLEILRTPPSNFINWRAYGLFWNNEDGGRAAVARAIGAMLRKEGGVSRAAAEAAAALHPILSAAAGRTTFGHERSLTTTSLALVQPANAIAVKTRYLQKLARDLIGRPLFRNEVLSEEEYDRVLAFANSIFAIMRDKWMWKPRDLWDVQGFFWVVGEHDAGVGEDDEEDSVVASGETMSQPTNLILYGPPGTGKTYATSARAVALCDGGLPAGGREALMKRYAELLERRRIAFVTFHQSYAYEDFVEGLRPEQSGDEDAANGVGFSLRPRAGIFRQIAELARDNRGPAAGVEFDRTRQVFKMSLGRNDQEEGATLFKSAIEGGYIVLGYGGDVDWSAPEYDQLDAIRAKWQDVQPDTSGMALLHKLRSVMKVGDYVVVSDGLKRFRAVGVVEGPYYFKAGEIREYNHRRNVRWLWHNADGRPQDLVYGRNFQRAALYQLDSEAVHWSALEQIISGAGEVAAGEPEPYVLIIDEINRANISKVFGELITLIEPDKRLGCTNEIKVTLPYSGETFGVPSNLHIIGAMNTADRSIALLDTALRRRFDFDELMPNPELLREAGQRSGVDLVEALKGLNERIEYLFDREHQIGHAFFIDCASRAHVDQVMRRKIIPLLAEYFYEDWEKIRQVLGETKNEGAFIRRIGLRPPPGVEHSGDERWRYQVRNDFDVDAYTQLKA
jgi:5-methylcytosine-specific restriction protein B